MATREVDENELLKLQSLSTVVSRMMAHPEARKKVLEARKLQDPNAVIPEMDVAAPVNAAIKSVEDQVKDLAKQLDEDKKDREATARRSELDSKWNGGRRAAREAGYTDDGIKALEEFMVEKGVIDHEIAMPAFERTQPPADMVATSKPGFDAFKAIADTGEEMKRLLDTKGQDNGAIRDLIQKSLSDVRTVGR